jgi:hypothetical protein
VVGFVLLLEIAVVLIFAKVMVPIRNGTSAGFWRNACGVDLGGADKGYVGHIYMPRDGWYIYFNQGMHGQSLFRVRRSVAVVDYPDVLERIEQSVNEESIEPGVHHVYKVIEQNRSQVEQDPDKLLSLLRDEKIKRLKQMDEKVLQYFISAEQEFAERWSRVQRFWINVIFEILFFVSLSLFAFWPWLRKKGKWYASFHLGLLPLLLFLPYYLGYSGWTFTSAGPSGGVLYPWVIVWFRNFPLWTPVDQRVLEILPKVFEPISQPLGPFLSISGVHPLGPVAALLIGIVIFVLTWVTFSVLRRKNLTAQTLTDNTPQSLDECNSQ